MKRALALFLAALLSLSLAGCQPTEEDNTVSASKTLAQAVYPEMAPYPDIMSYIDEENGESDGDALSAAYDAWWEDRTRQRDQDLGDTSGLDDFVERSTAQLLSGSEGENRVYSPLNVYMALSMLAEITDGDSRQQILDLLGADSLDALRAQTKGLWNVNYCDDGVNTSILANSLWLDQDVSYVPSTVERLAEDHYASAFQGEMGSAEFDQELQSWLNEQTGGLLEEQASGVHMDPETIVALASTVYFRAKWADEFAPSATEPDAFHGPGGDVTCDFMHQSDSRTYYWGEQFAAVGQGLVNSGEMWFLLPDEGVTVEELLSSGQAMDFLRNWDTWEDNKYLTVNLAVPKFDVASELDLIPGLKALGVSDVFDGTVSDFTPLTTDMDGIAVTQASHAARVTIDEEGCVAAAYMVMMGAGAAMPPEEEVDFVLNRPFLFAITGEGGQLLFVGVVNQPG